MTRIQRRLFALQDKKYGSFQARLMPTVDAKKVIGVRTPDLRAVAREIRAEGMAQKFLDALPHKYFEENQIHSILASQSKNFREALSLTKKFLPFVDNWATCDQLRPKSLGDDIPALRAETWRAVKSGKTYIVRFGINMLMKFFLGENFTEDSMRLVSSIPGGDYYVDMARAWYFATALAVRYDDAIRYVENGALDEWTRAKTIQKAIESFRVREGRKKYLRSLKASKA